MSTVVISWGDEDRPAKPIGTAESVEAAQKWCQIQANSMTKGVLRLLIWQKYLSRGTGPQTSHCTAKCTDGTFEIWTIGAVEE
jgi:hypothetical protein